MGPIVEPLEGPELDRLITALLNATGSVHMLIEEEQRSPFLDGVEVIDRSATRLRSTLAIFAEHHDDEELASITEFLALTTMLIAQENGFDDIFYES
jgi:hypothetical protein